MINDIMAYIWYREKVRKRIQAHNKTDLQTRQRADTRKISGQNQLMRPSFDLIT
jgi:hypothetical protein